MTKYYAKDYGILPNLDVAKGLIALFEMLKNDDGEKVVIFEAGTYYIDANNCDNHEMYVTNTVGNNEYKKGENRHNVPVGFYLENINNLVIDGNNSTFIIKGKCTNMALVNCENITLKNLQIDADKPDLHELKVVNKSRFFVEFLADKNSVVKDVNSCPCFVGNDYQTPLNHSAKTSWWNGYINANSTDKIIRHRHPLANAFKIEYMGNNRIKAYCLSTSKFNLNDRFYIFNVRRDYVGIFADRCKNVEIINVGQSISYSLALVCQDCENILVDSVRFAPKDKDFLMSSVADFIQICMCRGDAVVKNSYFDGAGDDLLNVHGVHFEIVKRYENKLTLSFKHPQTHGYNPFRIGDKVAYIDKNSLLEKGTSVVKKSAMINENEIEITLDSIGNFNIGDVIENISACPNLTFANNKSTRIITRGLLITTRGKVVVENNDFKSTSMSGVLLSDDAKSWYESGMCKDVTIRNNTFHYCEQTPILIKPENSVHKGCVHSNITIDANKFLSYKNECISAKSTSKITIINNTFANDDYLKTVNCDNIIDFDNKIIN